MRAYLDNAATTPLDERVIERMQTVMKDHFGNPSSIHSEGRASKALIEKARKDIAEWLGAAPGEIFFTSGGTEADNLVLVRAVADQNVRHIISSPIEHHAVLHTIQNLEKETDARVSYVKLKADGHIDLDDLERILKSNNEGRKLVSLMHGNNEIGNLTDLSAVGALCSEYDALFHSDTVQTIGHLPVNPKKDNINFLAASAHKFHGPKGVGFAYIDQDVQMKPLIHGGSQERNMRGGTENLYGIAGMHEALALAYDEMSADRNRIQDLKEGFCKKIREVFPEVSFNGDCESINSLYTILNVHFPGKSLGDMLLFSLDISGISASGGSACSSGSDVGSHVLQVIRTPEHPGASVRFSFGRFTTEEEVDFAINKIKETVLESS